MQGYQTLEPRETLDSFRYQAPSADATDQCAAGLHFPGSVRLLLFLSATKRLCLDAALTNNSLTYPMGSAKIAESLRNS